MAKDMEAVYLAKGARATTAIEGNTLTEEQALAAVQGDLVVPQGQEYQQQELENVIAAIRDVETGIWGGDQFVLTPSRIKSLNEQILRDLEVPEHVKPGEYREDSVVVGSVYRAAPARDCEYLISTLCDWLESPDFEPRGDGSWWDFAVAFLKAAVAHVYIAWIHPFGDGNGRTARLVEFGILTAAGIPSVAAHLLSNHYNATRNRYYEQLDYSSKSGGDLRKFFAYAAGGFVGQLQNELDDVHGWVLEAGWVNYVHGQFHEARTPATRRQRDLVLALPSDQYVPRARIPELNVQMAQAYAGKQAKTITRDVNALAEMGLIERGPRGVRARREIMLSFLPRVAPGADDGRADVLSSHDE